MTEKKSRNKTKRKPLFWLFFPCMLIYMELLMKLFVFGNITGPGLLFTILFSISIGMFISALCSIFNPRYNILIAKIISILIFLLFGTQLVYSKIFSMFLMLSSMQGAGNAFTSFFDVIIGEIIKNLPKLILLMVPTILFFIFSSGILRPRRAKKKLLIKELVFSASLHVITVIVISLSTTGIVNSRFIYFNSYIPDLVVSKFGIVTNLRLDIKNIVLGNASSTGLDPNIDLNVNNASMKSEDEEYQNIMEIDYGTLMENSDPSLTQAHQYFSALTPTNKNEYTGIFEGKNLIFITAESFSHYAIDEIATPTLYKIQQEGISFSNIYTPLWNVSTIDGEYVVHTGLIPEFGEWSLLFAGKNQNYMAFTYANLLKAKGYVAYAFHNHDYNYYSREISHPNLGYTYMAKDYGFTFPYTWPESDYEMMKATYDFYGDSQPFVAYYMTMSGHLEYNFINNRLAIKNREYVEHLDLTEQALAYVSANVELDRALEYLLNRLEEQGIAEDTVIIITPDHYPYGLSDEAFDDLAGHKVDREFEIFKSSLFIYCKGQEPMVVDTLCSSMDILPTVLNLFGLEYDSRLLMGYDIFSESERLVSFVDYSWMTEKGTYYALTDTFTPAEDTVVDDNYAKRIYNVVENKYKFSTVILEQDYYGNVFGNPNKG